MFGRWIAACASRRSFRYLLHPLAHRSSRIEPIGQEEQSLPLTWFRLPLDLKTPWSPMSFTFSDVLARTSCRVLSLPTTFAHRARYFRGYHPGRRHRGRHASTARETVRGDWLVLVSGDAFARDRLGSDRIASARRPLHLHPDDRIHDCSGLETFRCAHVASPSSRCAGGGCRGCVLNRHMVSGGLLAGRPFVIPARHRRRTGQLLGTLQSGISLRSSR